TGGLRFRVELQETVQHPSSRRSPAVSHGVCRSHRPLRGTIMTKKSDTRILRIMAGALFASDLTPRQLRELADRLLFDDEWRARLSNIVRELATLPERNAWQYQADLLDQRAREFTELATDITDLLSRKRIPKAQALQIL